MCSNKSQPAATALTAVVSDIGEQWSPNTPPPKIAASTNAGGKSKLTTNGMPIGIKMAKVPQLVPVVKDISAPAKNSIAGISHNGSDCATKPDI